MYADCDLVLTHNPGVEIIPEDLLDNYWHHQRGLCLGKCLQ